LLVEEATKKWFDEIKAATNKNEIRFRTQFIVSKGSVVSTLLDCVDDQNIDLIVEDTKGRSGIKKMLLGSVASGLATYALCPVLVNKVM
jgi:nucleotide-binding universal stress UspA family protein